MSDDTVVNTPFVEFVCGVPPSAIDYNGHLNDAAYAQVLTDANEMFLDALGLSATYRERTGCSMYTVEICLKFLHEVNRDDRVRAESWVVSADTKRLRVATTLLVADTPVATGDSLYLHVNTGAGKVCAFPDDRAGLLARIKRAHDEASATR
ncbi:MAG: thioesterase family protein [Actinomycetes bacterium]